MLLARPVLGGHRDAMTTLVVERPVVADAEVPDFLDFNPLTAAYAAPQACSTLDGAPPPRPR